MARAEQSKSPYTPNTVQTATNTHTVTVAGDERMENEVAVHPPVAVNALNVVHAEHSGNGGSGGGTPSGAVMVDAAGTVHAVHRLSTVSMEKQQSVTTTQPLKIRRTNSALSPSPPPRSQKSHRSSHKNSVHSKYSGSKSSKSSNVKQNSPRLAEPINLKSPAKTTPSRALNVSPSTTICLRPHPHPHPQHHMVPVRPAATTWDVHDVEHGVSRLSVTVPPRDDGHGRGREHEQGLHQMGGGHHAEQFPGSQSHDSFGDKEEVHRMSLRVMAPPLHTGSSNKDDRKNSGSTSKGLYRGTPRTINTEEHREFSAHTLNRGTLQTPTMSYTARHSQHPFVGNASSASKGSTSATQQTVSSELMPQHKHDPLTAPLTVPITEEDEV